jgi:hypothetical protein
VQTTTRVHLIIKLTRAALMGFINILGRITQFTNRWIKTVYSKSECKIHSRCFGIMGSHRNFGFNLVIKVSVELGYVFLSLKL